MSTNAQLTQQINNLLTSWNEREAQFRAWLAGTPTGGPNGDGRYPLSDASGVTQLVDCPAKLADTVGGPAGLSVNAQLLSSTARDVAITARDRAVAAETQVISLHAETADNRNLAMMYRDDAAAHAANALVHRTGAENAQSVVATAQADTEAARVETLGYRDETFTARDNTFVARNEAQVARDQAEAFALSIDPAALATKAELASELSALVDAAPGTLDTLNEIAAALGDDPNFATTVTAELATKAPLGHGHVIADVAGLQTALDGKAPVGNYALADHSHANYLQTTGGTLTGDLSISKTNPTLFLRGDANSSYPAVHFWATNFQGGTSLQARIQTFAPNRLLFDCDNTWFRTLGGVRVVTINSSGLTVDAGTLSAPNGITGSSLTLSGTLIAEGDIYLRHGKAGAANTNFALGDRYTLELLETTAIRNIAIGTNAGRFITTGSNNTIIGQYGGTASLSDTVWIGAGVTERLKIDATGGFINGGRVFFSNALAPLDQPFELQGTRPVANSHTPILRVETDGVRRSVELGSLGSSHWMGTIRLQGATNTGGVGRGSGGRIIFDTLNTATDPSSGVIELSATQQDGAVTGPQNLMVIKNSLTPVFKFQTDQTFETPKLRVTTPTVPASATAAGTKGDIAYDANYVYVCVATNSWKRSPLSTW